VDGGPSKLGNTKAPGDHSLGPFFVGNLTDGPRISLVGAEWEADNGSAPMRHLAATADRNDYWIRRHAVRQPSLIKVNSARDRYAGLTAIGQCLKEQYDALAIPIQPHLAALVEQLETQK
jgi:hypothetical protein